MKDIFSYCEIDEILPEKLSTRILELIKEDWELIDIISNHYSGFTMYKAKFKKMEL